MAAGSELVNVMTLLIMVSRVPLMVTVTVIVKGEPTVAVEGDEKFRIACGLPQPSVIDSAIAVVRAHNRSAVSGIPGPKLTSAVWKNHIKALQE